MRMLLGMCMGWLWLKRGIGEKKKTATLTAAVTAAVLLFVHKMCMFL